MFIRNERSVGDFIRFYPIVSTLIIVNLAIWLLVYLQLSLGYWMYNFGIGQNLAISYGQYWRLVTPIFLHGGFGHVAFNSFSLVLFGPALEQMLGRVKFVIIYFATGIFANFATYIIDVDSTTYHLGASGAIYGLFGIYIFMVLYRKHLIDPQNAQIVMTIFIIGIIMTFLRPNINIAAHIFGAIAGFAIAPLALKGAQAFSMTKNYMKMRSRTTANNNDIRFNPNRWNRRSKLNGKSLGNIFWIVLIILVLLGVIGRFF